MQQIIEVKNVENIKPYKFIKTEINVYSMEECFYHIRIYPIESLVDFYEEDFKKFFESEDKFYNYLNEGNKNINLKDFVINFLELAEYLDEDEKNVLEEILIEYEQDVSLGKILDEIKFQIKNFKFQNAYFVCKNYLENNNESYLIMNNLAIICNKLNKSDEAIFYLKKLVEVDNKNVFYNLNLALAYLQIDRVKAKEILENINNEEIINKEALELYYYLMGKVFGEIEYFEKSYQSTESTKSLFILVDELNKKDRFKESINLLENKENVESYLKLSETFIMMYKVDVAIKILLEKIEDFDLQKDLYMLSEVMYLYGQSFDFENGDIYLNEILKIENSLNNNFVALKLAKYYQLKSEKNATLEIYKNLIENIKSEYFEDIKKSEAFL